MHKPKFIQENETNKILWYLKIQTDFLILAWKPDLTSINNQKKNLFSRGFYYSCGPQSKNKRNQKERQIIRSCLRTEKAVEYENDSDTNCCWCTVNSHQILGT